MTVKIKVTYNRNFQKILKTLRFIKTSIDARKRLNLPIFYNFHPSFSKIPFSFFHNVESLFLKS